MRGMLMGSRKIAMLLLSAAIAFAAPVAADQFAAGQPRQSQVTYADIRASLALGCSDGNQGF
ncbi:MAG TPA: hypothetical protein VIK68_09985 [Sphingomicrobium sp.]